MELEKRGDQKRSQRQKLALVLAILLLVIIWPGIKVAMWAVLRTNPIRNTGLEILVPRDWGIEVVGAGVVAWKPCKTIICSGPRPSFKVNVDSHLVGEEVEWKRGAQEIITTRGFRLMSERSLNFSGKSSTCLESLTPGGQVCSACFRPSDGLVATFVGGRDELLEFYQALNSARTIQQKP